MKKGFTIIELVIVIGILAILSAIIIPQFVTASDKAKDSIVDIYNSCHIKMIDYETGSVLYEGENIDMTIDGYRLHSVEYKDNVVIMYMTKDKTGV